ncbi:hypothetical protein ACWCQZ_34335 [Streptomyces sp. NPDC002285]
MPGIAARVMGWQRRMGAVASPFGATGEAAPSGPVMVELHIAGAWVDITSYVLQRDGNQNVSITRGQRDEGSRPEQSTCSFQLNNRDGRFSPRNPTSPYYGQLGRNQQIRVSVARGDVKDYRFWGEVSSWPQHWDPTGTDVWIEVEAAGLMRRLNQGAVPTASLIRQAVTDPQLTGLVAYWPCEDATGATRCASALVNGSAMTFLAAPQLAASELFGASDPLPTFTAAAMRGGVATYPDPTATQVRFLLYVPPEGAPDLSVIVRVTQLEDISVADVRHYEVFFNAPDGAFVGVATPNALSLEAKATDGSPLGSPLDHTVDVRGKLLRVSIEVRENGTGVDQTLRTLDLLTGDETAVTRNVSTEQLTRVTSVTPFVSPFSAVDPDTAVGLAGGVIGHITVQNTITSITDLGIRASPVGETAGRRIERLCAEENIPFGAVGDLDETVAMGGQQRLKPIDVMRECELADDGMLLENLSVFGLSYRTRTSMYNQDPALTLSYPDGQLSQVPIPIDDDQRTKNKVTASRTGGVTPSTAEQTDGPLSTAPPPVGVGVYGDDVTLNVEADDTLPDQAAWRLSLGTVDEARFPQISVNLAHPEFTGNPALRQAALSVRPGDRLVITDPPPWLPPDDISQLVLGLSETIDHFQHRITFNCAPESPWRVGVLDDDILGRLDTDGSALAAAVDADDQTLLVTPTDAAGGLWTSDPDDFPLDVRAGGEVMRVSAIGSIITSNPYFETDTTGWSGNSASIARSTDVVHPAATASLLITPNGSSASGGANTSNSAYGTCSPGDEITVSMWVYSPGGWHDIRPAVDWADSSGSFLSSGLGNGFAVPAGEWTYLSQTVTAPASAGRFATRARHGGTPPASAVYYVWAVRAVQPGGRARDTFNRTVVDDWATSTSGHTWTLVGGVAGERDVTGTQGAVTLTTTPSSIRFQTLLSDVGDCDVRVLLSVSAVATGDAFLPAILLRYVDTSTFYRCRIHFETSGAMAASATRGATQLGTATTLPYTYSANDRFWLRGKLTGDRIRGRVWPEGHPEPDAWHVDQELNIGSIPIGAIGTTASAFSGNTNVNPQILVDQFELLDPQQMVVTREHNGVSKSQAAGTDVRLAQPTILSM